MMQKAQKRMAKWTVNILLLLLVASFGMWGLADYATGPTNPGVAFVGDREIRSDTFLSEAQRRINAIRRQTNEVLDTRAAIDRGVYAQTMSALIDRNVLLQTAADWNLGVSDDAVALEIRNDPGFQGPAGFDRFRFESIIRNAGFSEQGFIESLRGDMINRQIEGSLTAGLDRGHQILAKAIMAYQLETRVFTLIEFPNVRLAEAGEPTDAEIAAYHSDNAAEFSSPERRSARIVYLPPDALTADIVIDERPVEQAYEDQIDRFTTPGRRAVRQAIFPDEAAAQAVLERVAGGASFDDVIQEAVGGPPIDLGEIYEGELPGAVGDAAFAAQANSLAGPVQSDFGWHVIQVGDVVEKTVQPLAEVHDELVNELKLEAALEVLVDRANIIEDELAGGSRATDVAAALEIQPIELEPVDALGLSAAGVNATEALPPQAVAALFAQQPGEDLAAIELGDGSLLLVELLEIKAPETRPLAEVRDDVVAAIKADNLSELAARERDKLLERLKAGASLEEVADELGGSLRTTDAITRQSGEPGLSGPAREAAFALKTGELGAGADFGGASQFLFRLDEIRPADLGEDDASVANLTNAIGDAFADDIRLQYLAALREEIGFTVNEVNFRNAVDPNDIYFN